MNEQGNVNEKKSLINSIEILENKVAMLEDVARISGILIEKLKRTEQNEKASVDSDKLSSATNPDIIDLFNGIDLRLQVLANQIGRNLERAIVMIE